MKNNPDDNEIDIRISFWEDTISKIGILDEYESDGIWIEILNDNNRRFDGDFEEKK
jgi:hypothetical protein